VPYTASAEASQVFDLYAPRDHADRLRPAVVFVTGFPDAGMRRMVGCHAKDMESYVSWARLIAASGMVSVTYTNLDPWADAQRVLRHLRDHHVSLGIDVDKIGIWACSGNGPNALALLTTSQPRVARAALLYAYTLDDEESTFVADAAAQFRFVTPLVGQSPRDLRRDVPLLVARAGRDEMPHLNDALDAFAARALQTNLPLELVNLPEAPHAFDIQEANPTSRYGIARVIEFFARMLE
jgi:acetyl esterase/lipase